jgi:hypothetical protein
MDQSLTRRTELLRTTFHRRGLHKLLLGLVVVCIVTPAVMGQQVQTVEVEQAIKCDEKDHKLRLVTAATTVNDKQVRALAIVLTPADTTPSKVFGVYWFDPLRPLPTLRDNTDGSLKDKLLNYENGRSKNMPVAQAFFSTSKCSASDPQVIAIQTVLEAQNLTDFSATSFTLQGLAQQLKDKGVAINPERVKDASTGNLQLFQNLSNEIAFAKAIRNYVSNVLADGGMIQPVGPKPTEQEIARLVAQNGDLAEKVKQLETEKSSFFSATPGWLLLALPFMSMLSVGGLALIGLAIYHFVQQRGTTKKPLATTPPPKAENGQVLANPLERIISSAQERRETIEKNYADIASLAKNQKGKTYDELPETILKKLGLNSSKEHKHSKGIIDQVLQQVTNDAVQSQKHAKELGEAYSDLQNQLEEYQKTLLWPSKDGSASSASLSTPSAPATGTTPEMSEDLNELIKVVIDLKTSVDGFDLKVEQRFTGNQALQAFWYRLHDDTDFPKKLPDSFVSDVGEIIDLYKRLSERCGKRGQSINQTTTNLLQVIGELDYLRKNYLSAWLDESTSLAQIVEKIKTRMSNDADTVKDFNGIQQSLRTHFARDVKAKEGVTQLIQDQTTAQEKLKPFHPNGRFTETIDSVVATYETISRHIREVLPEQTGPIPQRVTSLVTEYRNIKPRADRAETLEAESKTLQTKLDAASCEVEAGKMLVEEIALELNFKPESLNHDQQQVTATLNRLQNERNSSPYLQLRMGLSSALLALEKAINTNGSVEHEKLIEALFIDKVKNGLKELLARMEECSGDQLWSDVLYEGFNQQWLHYLIRADLLLRTYYATRNEFSLLRRAASIACSSTLAALLEFQVEIVEVGLFEKLPVNMEMEPVYPGLRNLPAVMDKVGLMVQSITAGEVVVDVTSFPVFVRGVQKNRGRAAIANPSAWLQH